MNVTILLLTFLIGAIATCLSNKKIASKIALLFSALAFIQTIVLICQYNQGLLQTNYIVHWITSPNISFALKADGLALALVLLTTTLTPIIIWISIWI